jgi:energy-coupling factor transporter ATP-binding protein EcfA2
VRVIRTFSDRKQSTGILLSGVKGSGKSMLAKTISSMLRSEENGHVPTIVVSQNHYGPTFNRFIQSIDQPCVVMFDEFEKVYDKDDQEQVLSLLDGVFPTKKLFVFTVNSSWAVDRNMINRPGRVFYHLDFFGLSSNFIREYCHDNLKDKSLVEDVVKTGILFTDFNFDMMQALVEEMNRFGESVQDSMKFVNARSAFDETIYDLTVARKDGEPVSSVYPNEVGLSNVYRCRVQLSVREPYKKDHRDVEFVVQSSHLSKINSADGSLVFDVGDYLITAKKRTYEFRGNRLDLVF